MVRTSAYFVLRELFKSGGTKLYAAVVATLAALAASLLLAPGVAHAYEVHVSISGGGQVTETTPANLVGSNCYSSGTTPTGTVGKDCYPGDPNGDYGWGWDVDYVATPASGYDFVRWESDGNPKPVICDRSDPPATNSTYTGTTCKFKTYDNLQTRAVFADTTAPPSPTITSTSPSSSYVNGAKTFYFQLSGSDPTFRRFECRVVGYQSSFQSCSSGISVNPSTDGTYTFEVRAVDWSGNLSYTSSWMWTVDKTPPDTTLDPSVGPPDGSTLESNSATFGFSSNENQATFECSLDGKAFASCTSQTSYYDLADGKHTFQVRAVDRATNKDSTPATRTWTVSNAPRVDSGTLVPTKGQTEVLPLTTNVRATFSEAMYPDSLRDPFTQTSTTFKLQQWNSKKKKWKTLPATVSLSSDGKTATLDPYGGTETGTTETPLAANKKYKATITTGAKDLAGNALAQNFVWTFTTGST